MGRIDDKGVSSDKTDWFSPSSLEPGWEKALFLSVDRFAYGSAAKDSGGDKHRREIVIAKSIKTEKEFSHFLEECPEILKRRVANGRDTSDSARIEHVSLRNEESYGDRQNDEGNEGLPPFRQEVVV